MKEILNTLFVFLLSLNCYCQNVGIGTNSPAYKLDIKGRIRIKPDIQGNKSYTPGMWLDDYRNGSPIVFAGMQDSIRFGLLSAAKWGFSYNARSGNLSIGDSAANFYRLQLSGNDNGLGLYDNTGVYYGNMISNAGHLELSARYGTIVGGFTYPAYNLLLNPPAPGNSIPGNVGINSSNPIHAKLEVGGSVGATVAIFGADKYGVAIEANNPEIGFNFFYNNASKTIKAGYASVIGMLPSNGDLYIGNFKGNQSTADFGDITGYQTVLTIAQNGKMNTPATGGANLLPLAYGRVQTDGTILSGTGNFSLNVISEGVYEITLNSEPNMYLNKSQYTILVTPDTYPTTGTMIGSNITSDNVIQVLASVPKINFSNSTCNSCGTLSYINAIYASSPRYTDFSFLVYKF